MARPGPAPGAPRPLHQLDPDPRLPRKTRSPRPTTRSRQEWVTRYARWLVGATTDCLSAEQARALAEHEYEIAYDMSPEAAAARLLVWHDEAAEARAAAYSMAILIAKVAARGYRPAD